MKRIENIRSDINKFLSEQSINLNQVNVLNILFMVNEIFTGESESVGLNEKDEFEIFKEKSEKEKQGSNKQPDTTDMLELEGNYSDTEGKGLKIRTPNQTLCRLPISLAQLNAGNNFEKLKNKIRQLLHSLYS